MNNFVVWFEIPVKNLEKAIKFYSQVFAIEFQKADMMGNKMAFFPHEPGSASGALVEGKNYIPGDKGPLVYLNGGEDLSKPLANIEKAGGKVLLQKTSIGQHGFFAIFLDNEGNRLALHSMK